MTSSSIRGRIVQYEAPEWDPLLTLLHDYVDAFMWMFELELDDGARVHAFKHRITRRYLYLSRDGRAFVYREPDEYRERDPEELLEAVVGPRDAGDPRCE